MITVLYERKIGEKSYYVVQAVPDTGKKKLFIVSAFIGNSGYRKEISQSSDAKGPRATPKSEATNISVNSISNSSENVNGEQYSINTGNINTELST